MSLATRLSDLAFAIGTDMKQLRIFIAGSSTGNLTGLNTAVKTDLVSAINEVQSTAASATVPDATEILAGKVELASLAEVASGTDAVRVVTPLGVRQERSALKDEILGAGVPAALDTLDELAAALGDDANFAATLTTTLSNKQPLDSDLTAIAALVSAADQFPYATGAGAWTLGTVTAAARGLLDDVDVAAMRITLQVYSQAELGNLETDLVAVYNTAKA